MHEIEGQPPQPCQIGDWVTHPSDKKLVQIFGLMIERNKKLDRLQWLIMLEGWEFFRPYQFSEFQKTKG